MRRIDRRRRSAEKWRLERRALERVDFEMAGIEESGRCISQEIARSDFRLTAGWSFRYSFKTSAVRRK
jgi:hypothetical protein